MKSTSGAHFIGLDHVRALAAFTVFSYHFIWVTIKPGYVPAFFPFALIDEGHTGVALFMTLSGYLFAKLLDGKRIDYLAFFCNRALRLLPLLVVVIIIVGVQKYLAGEDMVSYTRSIIAGAVKPYLPNGGWSITVEFHFYALLPLLLWMVRKSRLLPLALIAGALALRFIVWHHQGTVQALAYSTIVGRVDQFVLGIVLFQFRSHIAMRHVLGAGALVALGLFYWYFDSLGGYYELGAYPSATPIWIWLPTLEGLCYAVAIAWYDSSFTHSTRGFSRLLSTMGEYSYSIYLLHFFVVFAVAKFIHERVMDLSNFYVACAWAVLGFLAMMPIGYLSFRFIEGPFLKLRRRYILPEQPRRLETLNA